MTIVYFTNEKEPQKIFVYKHIPVCLTCKRLGFGTAAMESRRAIVRGMFDSKPVDIAVNYCHNCDKYILDENILKQKEEEMGQPLLFFRAKEEIKERQGKSSGNKNREFQAETILSQCGYIAQEDKQPTYVRRRILKTILDRGYATKVEIESILAAFQRTRPQCIWAQKIWAEDEAWVSDYNAESELLVGEKSMVEYDKSMRNISYTERLYSIDRNLQRELSVATTAYFREIRTENDSLEKKIVDLSEVVEKYNDMVTMNHKLKIAAAENPLTEYLNSMTVQVKEINKKTDVKSISDVLLTKTKIIHLSEMDDFFYGCNSTHLCADENWLEKIKKYTAAAYVKKIKDVNRGLYDEVSVSDKVMAYNFLKSMPKADMPVLRKYLQEVLEMAKQNSNGDTLSGNKARKYLQEVIDAIVGEEKEPYIAKNQDTAYIQNCFASKMHLQNGRVRIDIVPLPYSAMEILIATVLRHKLEQPKPIVEPKPIAEPAIQKSEPKPLDTKKEEIDVGENTADVSAAEEDEGHSSKFHEVSTHAFWTGWSLYQKAKAKLFRQK